LSKKPNIRFRIDFAENSNIGPGKIDLLEAIKDRGSLSVSARVLKLSYRRAWLLLDSLNKSFDKPVTINSVGGPGGGGAQVTEFGLLLIRRYRELEREIGVITNERLKDILPRVSGSASATKSSLRRTSLTKSRRRG
jgi:molybdate transport system regulatory protein